MLIILWIYKNYAITYKLWFYDDNIIHLYEHILARSLIQGRICNFGKDFLHSLLLFWSILIELLLRARFRLKFLGFFVLRLQQNSNWRLWFPRFCECEGRSFLAQLLLSRLREWIFRNLSQGFSSIILSNPLKGRWFLDVEPSCWQSASLLCTLWKAASESNLSNLPMN